jgi:uncharacterized protein (DUF924 family)
MSWIESMSWINVVNEFWFHELGPRDWFNGGPGVDLLIRERFGGLRENLKQYPPGFELLDANGSVAAVIVFDQFSRNLFRGSAEAFATDSLALTLASHATNTKMDAPLGLHQRQFLYMPFMHSENRDTQARSVELFRELGDRELLSYATHHKAIIDLFGRFPHRNAVLGRQSTSAEEAFLANERADGSESQNLLFQPQSAPPPRRRERFVPTR